MNLDALSPLPTQVPTPPSRWRSRVLVPCTILAIALTLVLSVSWRTLFPGTTVSVVPVMVKEVSSSGGGAIFTATGWLEPDPFPIYVTALADGVVEQVLALEGDTVKKGDVLARLIADDANLALLTAEAELGIRKAELARARSVADAEEQVLQTLVERQRAVSAAHGWVAQLNAEKQQATLQVAAAQAQLASLEDEYQRKAQLSSAGGISRGELRRLELARETQGAQVAALRESTQVIDGKLQSAAAELQAAERNKELLIDEHREVGVARARVDMAQAAVAAADAARQGAQLRLDRMTIVAPVDGVVLRRTISPGSTLQAAGSAPHASHTFHLYDPSRLQVRVDVPLADATAVSHEQEVEVVVEVLPDQTFRGRVSRRVHEADVQKNTIEVKVSIEEPVADLKPEMLARVRFLATGTSTSRQRVLAPLAYLQRAEDGSATVWIVTDRSRSGGVAQQRKLQLGSTRVEAEDGSVWQEVSSGLQPGDWIIVTPVGLDSGDPVVVGEES